MRKEKHKKIIKGVVIVFVSICFFTLLITTVMAVDDYKLLVGLPGMTENTAPGLGPYLVNMFKIGIGVAGVLAVVMITIGGVQYMTSEAISGKGEAKIRINRAIFGLVLALSSFLLLNTINTNLTESELTLKPVPAPPVTPPTPYEKQFQGSCRPYSTGPLRICYGPTGPACQANCNNTCPPASSVIYQSPCKDTGGPASCKPTGLGSIMWCGRNTTTKDTCEADCESKCLKTPVQEQPCTEIGPGGDF